MSRPIVQLLDLLGKKWVLRVLWELHLEPATFRSLQQRCGDLSPTTVNQRVSLLREAGLVIRRDQQGYALSELGEELVSLFAPVNQFAEKWAETRQDHES